VAVACRPSYDRRIPKLAPAKNWRQGAPEPEWMQKGIPYLQREKEKEKYRVTDEDPGDSRAAM